MVVPFAQLFRVLGTNRAKVDEALASANAPWSSVLSEAGRRNEVATACVVAYLRRRLDAERDTWEMMADKAVDWLDAPLRSVGASVEDLETCLASIFLLEKLHDESPNTVMPLKHGGIFDRLGGSLFGERIGCGRIDRRED